MKLPKPTHREAIALFRLGVIGDLLTRDLERGELRRELRSRARQSYRPPGAERRRQYHFKTLQRWYYEAKKDLVGGLLPESRARGYALELAGEARELLLDVRRQHRSASAEQILEEAVRHGVVRQGAVSVSTLRRLYASEDLGRRSRRRAERGVVGRRRWQAHRPSELWHGDVCHLVLQGEDGRPRRVLVHGLLDDASRFVVALAARQHERERDMLEVLCGALCRHPAPETLYLDNGSCYRGDVLKLVCKRLGIRLVHAEPHSPESRGKMERFWRTMRQRCTDHLAPSASLHDVNQALWSWQDADYSRRPHAGLMGDTPRRRYLEGLERQRVPLTPRELARALEVEVQRQVRKDGTFDLDSATWEVVGGHLTGKRIKLLVDALSGRLLSASYRGRPVRFGPCDPVANRRRRRQQAPEPQPSRDVPFDPITALLEKARKENLDD